MICPKCRGVGRIPFGEEPEIYTNEEWFCGLNTKGKAEVLTDLVLRLCPLLPTNERKVLIKQQILNWLKAVHKE